MTLRIVPFDSLTETHRDEAASVLMKALAHVPSAWHDRLSARAEVDSFFGASERRAFAMLDNEKLVGWIGAIDSHSHGWELHPLVVAPALQRHGLGTRLLEALESEAGKAGILTLWLGSDDDFGGTSLFGVDLHPDVLGSLSRIAQTPKGHPFGFYLERGFALVGVLPDVEGAGKHDILLAKRIASRR